MRDYLFHGKRKDNGEWVYWNIYGEFCTSKGRRTRLIIKTPYGEKYYHYIHEIKQLIDPSTVAQYTGLTDKNGKGIFEGDIVKTDKFSEPNKQYIIKYDLLFGAFIGHDRYNFYFVTFDGHSDEFEVIGNIHDNPELLKGD